MSEYYDDEEVLFKLNSEILSKKTTYVVERLLGEGGFGAVYKVRDSKTGKHYAMKVEKRHEKRPSKLKMEIVILKLVSKERKNSHFTEIVDRGRREKEGFSFLVMELAGPSLADLKRKRGKVAVFAHEIFEGRKMMLLLLLLPFTMRNGKADRIS